MLHKKARPKRKGLLSNFGNSHNVTTESKDCSNNNNNLYKVLNKLNSKLSSLLLDIKYTSNIIHNKFNNKLGLTLLNSIPVLSIFVLLGIMSYAIVSPSNIADLISLGLASSIDSSNSSNETYAAESTSNTSSLIIDNGNLDNVSNTTEGNVTYSSHEVKVSASNITGYSLKITGPTGLSGSTEIKGANNNTPANMANNTWGYGWDDISKADSNISYKSFTDTAQDLESNSSATSVDLTKKLVFAVKFGSDAASGHYKANVTLNLAVTPKTVTTNYSVNYNMNGGTGGPSNVSGTMSGSSYTYTISSTKPTRSGYSFQGWSINNSTTIHYSPGNSITLTTTAPTVTLYAVWKAAALDSVTTMQEMTTSICNSAAIGSSKTLTDARDNNTYVVRKLADGNCWMVDNLKLNLKEISSYMSSNTDLDSGVSFDGSSATLNNGKWTSTSTGVIAYSTGPKTIFNGGSWKTEYGYYYSWCAATAGSCSSATTGGAEASSSICPKGWRLPKGGASGNFQTLFDLYSSLGSERILLGAEAEIKGGAYFLDAGGVSSSGMFGGGSRGEYWSRTSNGSYAYTLSFSASAVNPATANSMYKYQGIPVRCIAYAN